MRDVWLPAHRYARLQRELNFNNARADVQFSAWSGVCYITPLLGGYIADTYLGRYRTILIFCCIYLVGLVMVVIGSVPGDIDAGFFFAAIYIIALGTGGIKPNVSTMGADQFDERYSRDRLEMQSFFNWFYWMVNLGALLAYSLVAYFCQYGLPSAGGERWGFFLGYMVPAVAMFVGIIVFLLGTPRYTLKRPAGSVVAVALSIVYEACVTRHGAPRPPSAAVLDKASDIHGGSFPDRTVQGVKYVARLVPFLLVLVPFWGIYSQMSTAFQNQACQMDLDLGSGVQMPVAALNSFDTIAILLLVPVFDRIVYPRVSAWLGRPVTMLEKIGAGLVFAILAMCVAAIVEAARLAYAPPAGGYDDAAARAHFTPCQDLRDYDPYTYQAYLAGDDTDDGANNGAPLYCSKVCNDYYINPATQLRTLNLTCISCDDLPQTSGLSVFWQVPQFCLIGVAEILTAITALEFFYSQAPTAMRSVSQSLNLATTALGSFLVIPLLLLVNEADPSAAWVPANLDEGHLAWYFVLLAALMALTLAWFVRLAAGYEYKTTAELSVLDDAELTAPLPGDRRGLLPGASPPHSQHGDSKRISSPRSAASSRQDARALAAAERLSTLSDVDASVADLHARSQSLSSSYADGPRFSVDAFASAAPSFSAAASPAPGDVAAEGRSSTSGSSAGRRSVASFEIGNPLHPPHDADAAR